MASTCADWPSGPDQPRQAVLLDIADVGLEHLAEVVDQPRFGFAAPQGDGPVLLQLHPQAVGELAPHHRPGAPRARASKAWRAPARFTVKKLPASRGATLARSVTALLCVTSPCTVMPPMAKSGWRSAHHEHRRQQQDDASRRTAPWR